MTNIEFLKAEVLELPQCEGELQPDAARFHHREGDPDPWRCKTRAALKINGKAYCIKHARVLALDLLINPPTEEKG